MARQQLHYPGEQPGDIFDRSGMAQMPGIRGFDDPYAQPQQQGGIPCLMTLLWEAYARHIKLKLDARRAKGLSANTVENALAQAPATHFLEFCEAYLNKHRPVQQFPGDANLGFMLSNNVRALLCPPVPGGFAGAGGQMQDGGAVQVTHGQSQPGMEGIIQDDGGIRVI